MLRGAAEFVGHSSPTLGLMTAGIRLESTPPSDMPCEVPHLTRPPNTDVSLRHRYNCSSAFRAGQLANR
jgi:hypothetical protein